MPVLFDDGGCIADMADAALAEDVEFLETDFLGHIHIPLGGQEPFGRKIERRISGHRLLGDQHAAGMDASHVGEIGDLCSDLEDPVEDLAAVETVRRFIDQQVDLLLRQPVYLAQFTEYRTSPEGGAGADEGRMLFAVTFEDVIQHVVTLLPRIIDVEIRAGWCVWD